MKSESIKKKFNWKVFIGILIFIVLGLGLYFTNVSNTLYFENSLLQNDEGEAFDAFFPLGTEYRMVSSENSEWQTQIVQMIVDEYIEEENYSYLKVNYSIGSLDEGTLENKSAKVLLTAKNEFWKEYTGEDYDEMIAKVWLLMFDDPGVLVFDTWNEEIDFRMIGWTRETETTMVSQSGEPFSFSLYEIDSFKETFPKDTLISFRTVAYYPEEELEDYDCLLFSVEQCLTGRYYSENGGYADLFESTSKDIMLIPLSGFILETL